MPEILQYDFMIRALAGGVAVGVLAPAFGLFIVLRRLSLIADTLSHVALMGVAIGFITQTAPVFVALGATTVSAAGIEQLRSRGRMPGDAALAVFLYSALAVAVVLISRSAGFNVDLMGFLFGDILSVTAVDLWLAGALMALVVGFVVVFYSELVQSAFDPEMARVSGVRVNTVNLALAVLTGAIVTASMQIVGVLLVGGLIVIPVLASLRLASSFRLALLLAVAFGVAGSILGLAASFYLDLSAGGAVIIVLVLFLVGSEALARLLRRLSRTRGLTERITGSRVDSTAARR